MNFGAEGFSGATLHSITESERKNNQELFDFAKRCAALALKITQIFQLLENNPKVVPCTFFSRCVAHFQSAILLAEGGMTVESLIITRSLFETAFALTALCNQSITLVDLLEHDKAGRVKNANAMITAPHVNAKRHRKRLQKYSDSNKGEKGLSVSDLASKAGFLVLYNYHYRRISHGMAHANLTSTDPYVNYENGILRVEYKPVLKYTRAAILSATAGIIISISAVNELDLGSDDTKSERDSLWIDYMLFNDRYDPWKDQII